MWHNSGAKITLGSDLGGTHSSSEAKLLSEASTVGAITGTLAIIEKCLSLVSTLLAAHHPAFKHGGKAMDSVPKGRYIIT